jgi:P2 family phage contractile tail tube protein
MIPKILKNFNLFIDGRGYVGKVEEVNPPKLNIKTEEFRAGGMDSPVMVDMGVEKLEGSFTLLEYDKDVLKQFDYKAHLCIRYQFCRLKQILAAKLDKYI